MWRPPGAGTRMTEEEFRLLRDLVQEHCGILFRDDARYLVERRLAPRLEALGLATFGAYHLHLRCAAPGDGELADAVDLLTTNETYFWREPLQLAAFARDVLPSLARTHARARRLNILSAGCSTGEEPYTLAVMVKQSGLFEGWDVQIHGSDISRR